jgi:formylmethanofuran dehydrogenase subunit E
LTIHLPIFSFSSSKEGKRKCSFSFPKHTREENEAKEVSQVAMKNQTPYVVRPVEKQPKRKFYRYTKRICAECGFIHLYRQVAKKQPVRYGCVQAYPPLKTYTVSMYLTIAAETEEEAREITWK